MLHQHAKLFTWLTATADWISPLHHLTVVPPDRARALLRDGADVHASRAPGCPTPLSLALKLEGKKRASPGSTAHLVLLAAALWSPRNHILFPERDRARAVQLMCLGWQLSRSGAFEGHEASLTDIWRDFVLAHAVQRGGEGDGECGGGGSSEGECSAGSPMAN
jgi:hypothetical protein